MRKRVNQRPSNHYFLGIDVSKGYSDFVILDTQKAVVEPNFQLDDTFTGHGVLYEVLENFFQAHPDAMLFAGVESTGGYENNWYSTLRKLSDNFNLQTTRLNPFGVSHHTKAGRNRTTTDKISARNIAEYMMNHPEKILYEQDGYYRECRKQWKFIKMLTKQKTQLLNQLQSLLYSSNRGLVKYCKDGVSDWILKLLVTYPTCSKLARAQVRTVAKIPYVSPKKAQNLIHDAKETVRVSSLTDQTSAQIIKSTAQQILHLSGLIKEQLNTLTKKVDMDEEIRQLKTFKGIGDYSALGLLLIIGAIKRFPSAKHLCSFFGLHPVFRESGDGISGVRMSKEGNKDARDILFMVTQSAIVSNPLIKEIYDYHVNRGKSKMCAIGICMHKIARIIYGMLKNRQDFDPDVDRRHRARMTRHHENRRVISVNDRKRRYQQLDQQAPISRRQSKKRREQETPQNGLAIKSGVGDPTPEKLVPA